MWIHLLLIVLFLSTAAFLVIKNPIQYRRVQYVDKVIPADADPAESKGRVLRLGDGVYEDGKRVSNDAHFVVVSDTGEAYRRTDLAKPLHEDSDIPEGDVFAGGEWTSRLNTDAVSHDAITLPVANTRSSWTNTMDVADIKTGTQCADTVRATNVVYDGPTDEENPRADTVCGTLHAKDIQAGTFECETGVRVDAKATSGPVVASQIVFTTNQSTAADVVLKTVDITGLSALVLTEEDSGTHFVNHGPPVRITYPAPRPGLYFRIGGRHVFGTNASYFTY